VDGNRPLQLLLAPELRRWQHTRRCRLLLDRGNLYGTTAEGGTAARDGVVFELTPKPAGGWKETVHFSSSVGAGPNAALITDTGGNLYGPATADGNQGGGSVYELVRATGGKWIPRLLYGFCARPLCADGADPAAPLSWTRRETCTARRPSVRPTPTASCSS
jgi:uncharacterized repeat protein (TIGR03803 family)